MVRLGPSADVQSRAKKPSSLAASLGPPARRLVRNVSPVEMPAADALEEIGVAAFAQLADASRDEAKIALAALDANILLLERLLVHRPSCLVRQMT